MGIELKQIDEYVAGSKIMRKKAEEIIAASNVGLITQLTEEQFQTIVIDNNNEYVIKIDISAIYATKCDCLTNQTYNKCQHVLAFLIDLNKYLNSEKRSELTKEEIATNNFKNYFEYDYNIQKVINIRPKFLISDESNVSKISLVIKYEGEREFKVANIATTINSLINNKSLEIVKKMPIISGNYKLNEQTQKLINIISLNEMYINACNNSILIHELELSSFEMVAILNLLKGQMVDINFTEGMLLSPPINQKLVIKRLKKEIKVSSEVDYKMREIIAGRLIKSHDKYYLLDEDESKLFELLRPLLKKDVDAINLPLKYYEKFMIKSKSQLEALFKIGCDEEFNVPFVECQLIKKVIVTSVNTKRVALRIEFCYDDVVYGYDGYTISDNLRLVKRDFAGERKLLEKFNLSMYDAVATNEQIGYLMTKNNNQTYDLIVNVLPTLGDDVEVFIDQSIEDSFTPLDAKSFQISLNHNQDLNFFEFEYELNDFTAEQIHELLKAYNKGEQFYFADDTKYIPFNDDKIIAQLNFISNIDSEFKANNEKIPFYRYLTLKQISGKLFDNVNTDQILEQKLVSIREIKVDSSTLYDVKVREYQQIGMDWLHKLHHFKLGGILADEMGLGKTLQIIGYLNANKGLKTLIIVPKALMYNWAQEITRFAPSLTYTVVNGVKTERIKLLAENEADILITSYNMLRIDIDMYKDEFDVCIIDEAQTIKNPQVQVTKAVKKINAHIKFALTGTPLENNLLDIWSITDFVNPNYLGTQSSFKNKFISERNTELLKFHLSPIMLRRVKKDVLQELPEKIETPVFCELTPKQKIVYASYVRDYNERLSQIISSEQMASSQLEVLALLTRLRQIACHPSLFIDNYDGDSGKLELLEELINENVENGNKILVFSQFTSFLKIVEQMIAQTDLKYYYLDGATKAQERIELVDKFNRDDTNVFLISLKAGGVGLNLTSASTVIHLDPWWNPQVESQATDRAHRIGQKNVVQVNKLITKGTIEEKIYLLQQEKKELTDDILSLDSKMLSSLSPTEIIDLFTIE